MEDNLIKANEYIQEGINLANKSEFRQAITKFKKAQKYSNNPNPPFLIGLAYQNLGDNSKAIKYYKKTIRIDPKFAVSYNNLGNIYKLQNKDKDAIINYKKALSINPNLAEPHSNLATIYFAQGKIDKSIKHINKAILNDSDYAPQYFQLAVIQANSKDYQSAIASIEKYFVYEPNDAKAYAFLGNIYTKLLDYEMARKNLEKAISIDAGYVVAYSDLANTYLNNQQLDEAISIYKKILQIDPNARGILNDLGVTYMRQRKFDTAIRTLKKSTKKYPNDARAYYHLGLLYEIKKELNLSIKNLKKAYEIDPKLYPALNSLVATTSQARSWEDIKKYSGKLDKLTKKQLADGLKTAEAPFINVVRCANPALNLAVAKSWSDDMVKTASPINISFTFTKKKSKKIRIGYLSCDFIDHPTSHLIMGLLEKHNRKRFEIYTYSYGPDDKSYYRKKVEKISDKFVDGQSIGNLQIAQKINEDGVDILVDLKGHTRNNRIEICAPRPAPVQVTYLGFPGSTGASFFDYAIVDKIVVPRVNAKYFNEKLVYMPNCYQINDDKQKIAKFSYNRSFFGLPQKAFVFASFNHTYKIDLETLTSWTKILKKTKDSILWLYRSNPYAEKNIKEKAEKLGVDPKRILFTTWLPKQNHLARITVSDICLDTFTCNGHTTTSDALWAGVPVVCLQGNHFASRVSASILDATGLPELIAKNKTQYEKIATSYANNPEKLTKLKEKLAKNKKTKPLFDTARFTKDIERAYIIIWDNYQKGQKPRTISV